MKIKMNTYLIIIRKWKVAININIKIKIKIKLIINQGIRSKLMIRKGNKGVIRFSLILVRMLMRRNWVIF